MSHLLHSHKDEAEKLFQQNRAFFYRRFVIMLVIP